MQVWRSSQLVIDEVILRTDPDEIAFHYRFDDISNRRWRDDSNESIWRTGTLEPVAYGS